MKRNRFFIVFTVILLISFILSACRQNARPNGGGGGVSNETPVDPSRADADTSQQLSFQVGRNDYVISVDNTPREFVIHVPVGYDASQPTPVVFMFHGTNGGGPAFYDYTNWASKADEVTAIVVYPTSWQYFIVAENAVERKWNDVGMKLITPEGTELKDDVKFTRMMVELLRVTFNVDDKRIFATGFSNGGGFINSRLMLEMADTFAAFSSSGSGTKLSRIDANPPPPISKSYYAMMGTMEDLVSIGIGVPLPFPIDADEIFANEVFGAMLVNTATLLNLDPSRYEVSHPRADYTVILFNHSLTGDDNEYIFHMVKDMLHVYPDGEMIPRGLDAVDVFWEFFMRHPMK